MYNFDSITNRCKTNSLKWDGLKEKYGREDLIPLWIADMDFEVSPSIVKSLQERIKHPIYGYMYCSDDYYKSIIRWMKRRHSWEVEKGMDCIYSWSCFSP